MSELRKDIPNNSPGNRLFYAGNVSGVLLIDHRSTCPASTLGCSAPLRWSSLLFIPLTAVVSSVLAITPVGSLRAIITSPLAESTTTSGRTSKAWGGDSSGGTTDQRKSAIAFGSSISILLHYSALYQLLWSVQSQLGGGAATIRVMASFPYAPPCVPLILSANVDTINYPLDSRGNSEESCGGGGGGEGERRADTIHSPIS